MHSSDNQAFFSFLQQPTPTTHTHAINWVFCVDALTQVLLEEKLLPRVLSGSSVGSVFAAMCGSYRDDELLEILE